MSGFFARRKAARLRRAVDRHKSAAIALMQSGRFAEAAEHNGKAIEAVVPLRFLEPDDPEHTCQLASIFYNHAACLDGLGNTLAAVSTARQALDEYKRAIGGDPEPEHVLLADLLNLAGHRRAGLDPLEVVASIADVKARLARLLAKSSGSAAATEVHELGRAAIATYEKLSARDPRLAPDLERVRRQYSAAQQHLR